MNDSWPWLIITNDWQCWVWNECSCKWKVLNDWRWRQTKLLPERCPRQKWWKLLLLHNRMHKPGQTAISILPGCSHSEIVHHPQLSTFKVYIWQFTKTIRFFISGTRNPVMFPNPFEIPYSVPDLVKTMKRPTSCKTCLVQGWWGSVYNWTLCPHWRKRWTPRPQLQPPKNDQIANQKISSLHGCTIILTIRSR